MRTESNTFPFSVITYFPSRFAEGASGVARRVFSKTAETIANFFSGIPAIYSTPPKQGGKLVERGDINGIGWIGTNLQKFAQDGGVITFNAAYAEEIGGYPKGAILCMYDDDNGYYFVMSTKDENKDNFLTSQSYIGPNPTDSWRRITTTKLDLAAVEEMASKAYKFKGSVDTYNDLNNSSKVTSKKIGDVWDVKDTGENYAYAGSGKGPKGDGWDSLGKVFELSDYVKKTDVQSSLSNSTLPPTTKLLNDQIANAKTYADGVGVSTLSLAVAKSEVQSTISDSTLPPTTKLLKEQISETKTYADGVGTTTLGKAVAKNEVQNELGDSTLPPSTKLVKDKISEVKLYADAIKTSLTTSSYNYKGARTSKPTASSPTTHVTNDVWFCMNETKYYAYLDGSWKVVDPTIDLIVQHLKSLTTTGSV